MKTLNFNCHSQDVDKLEKLLNDSDFFADREYNTFVFEEEYIDQLEICLTEIIIAPNDINGYFECMEA